MGHPDGSVEVFHKEFEEEMYACRFVVDHCCNWLLRFCLFSKTGY